MMLLMAAWLKPGPAEGASARIWPAEVALLCAALIWGGSFTVVKQALGEISWVYFNALRFTLALLALGPLVRWDECRRAARPGLLLSLFLFAGFAFQTSGLLYTTPAKSAFITASSVLGVPVFLRFFFGTRVERSSAAGVALGLPGLYLLTAPEASQAFNAGDLLTALCAAAWALHIIWIGRFAPHHPPLALAAVQAAATAGGFWLLTLAGGTAGRVPPGAAAALLYTGVLATSLCFALQVWAQRRLSPTRTGLLLATEPVFALVFAWRVSGEWLAPSQLAGAALTLAGVVIAEAGARLASPRLCDKITASSFTRVCRRLFRP